MPEDDAIDLPTGGTLKPPPNMTPEQRERWNKVVQQQTQAKAAEPKELSSEPTWTTTSKKSEETPAPPVDLGKAEQEQAAEVAAGWEEVGQQKLLRSMEVETEKANAAKYYAQAQDYVKTLLNQGISEEKINATELEEINPQTGRTFTLGEYLSYMAEITAPALPPKLPPGTTADQIKSLGLSPKNENELLEALDTGPTIQAAAKLPTFQVREYLLPDGGTVRFQPDHPHVLITHADPLTGLQKLTAEGFEGTGLGEEHSPLMESLEEGYETVSKIWDEYKDSKSKQRAEAWRQQQYDYLRPILKSLHPDILKQIDSSGYDALPAEKKATVEQLARTYKGQLQHYKHTVEGRIEDIKDTSIAAAKAAEKAGEWLWDRKTNVGQNDYIKIANWLEELGWKYPGTNLPSAAEILKFRTADEKAELLGLKPKLKDSGVIEALERVPWLQKALDEKGLLPEIWEAEAAGDKQLRAPDTDDFLTAQEEAGNISVPESEKAKTQALREESAGVRSALSDVLRYSNVPIYINTAREIDTQKTLTTFTAYWLQHLADEHYLDIYRAEVGNEKAGHVPIWWLSQGKRKEEGVWGRLEAMATKQAGLDVARAYAKGSGYTWVDVDPVSTEKWLTEQMLKIPQQVGGRLTLARQVAIFPIASSLPKPTIAYTSGESIRERSIEYWKRGTSYDYITHNSPTYYLAGMLEAHKARSARMLWENGIDSWEDIADDPAKVFSLLSDQAMYALGATEDPEKTQELIHHLRRGRFLNETLGQIFYEGAKSAGIGEDWAEDWSRFGTTIGWGAEFVPFLGADGVSIGLSALGAGIKTIRNTAKNWAKTATFVERAAQTAPTMERFLAEVTSHSPTAAEMVKRMVQWETKVQNEVVETIRRIRLSSEREYAQLEGLMDEAGLSGSWPNLPGSHLNTAEQRAIREREHVRRLRDEHTSRGEKLDEVELRVKAETAVETEIEAALGFIQRRTYDGDKYAVTTLTGDVTNYTRQKGKWFRIDGEAGAEKLVPVDLNVLLGGKLTHGRSFEYIETAGHAELRKAAEREAFANVPAGHPLEKEFAKTSIPMAQQKEQEAAGILALAEQKLKEFRRDSKDVYAQLKKFDDVVKKLDKELAQVRAKHGALVGAREGGPEFTDFRAWRTKMAAVEAEIVAAREAFEKLTGREFTTSVNAPPAYLPTGPTPTRPPTPNEIKRAEARLRAALAEDVKLSKELESLKPAVLRNIDEAHKLYEAIVRVQAKKDSVVKAFNASGIGKKAEEFVKRSAQLSGKSVQTTPQAMTEAVLTLGRQYERQLKLATKNLGSATKTLAAASKRYRVSTSAGQTARDAFEASWGKYKKEQGVSGEWRNVARSFALHLKTGLDAIQDAPSRVKKFKDVLKAATRSEDAEGNRTIIPAKLIQELEDEFGADTVQFVVRSISEAYDEHLMDPGLAIGGPAGDVLRRIVTESAEKTADFQMEITAAEVHLLGDIRDVLQKNWKLAHKDSASITIVQAMELSQKYDPEWVDPTWYSALTNYARKVKYAFLDPERAKVSGLSEDILDVVKAAHYTRDRFNVELLALSDLADAAGDALFHQGRKTEFLKTIVGEDRAADIAKSKERSQIYADAMYAYFDKKTGIPMSGERSWYHGRWQEIRDYMLSDQKYLDKHNHYDMEFKRWLEFKEVAPANRNVPFATWQKAHGDKVDEYSTGNALHAISRTWLPRWHPVAKTSITFSNKDSARLYSSAYELLRINKEQGGSMRDFFEALASDTRGYWQKGDVQLGQATTIVEEAAKGKKRQFQRTGSKFPQDPELVRSLAMGSLALAHVAVEARTRDAILRATGGLIDPKLGEDVSNFFGGALMDVQNLRGTLEALNTYGIPFTQDYVRTLDKARKMSTALVKMGDDTQGRQIFNVQHIADRMDEGIPRITKEVSERFAAARDPAEIFAIGRELDLVRLWKTSMVTGLVIPQPRHWWNNFWGDWGQMQAEFGAATATKVNFQLVMGAPFWTDFFYKYHKEHANKFYGQPVLGSVFNALFNQHAQPIWRGHKGILRTKGGQQIPYEKIRRVMVEEGILDTMVHEELLQAFTRVTPSFYQQLLNKDPTGVLAGAQGWRDGIAHMAQFVQQRQRGNLFMELVHQGYSLKAAARLTKKALYDWKHALTDFEVRTVARISPFWRFWKVALKQASALYTDPFVKPDETAIKAIYARSMGARLRQQHTMMGVGPQIYDPQLDKQHADNQDWHDYYARVLRPTWAWNRMAFIRPNTIEQQRYYRAMRGDEYTHNMMLMPPYTILDASEILATFPAALIGMAASAGALGSGMKSAVNPGAMAENFFRPLSDMVFPHHKAIMHSAGQSVAMDFGQWETGKMVRVTPGEAAVADALGVGVYMGPFSGFGALAGAIGKGGGPYRMLAGGALGATLGAGLAQTSAFNPDVVGRSKEDPTVPVMSKGAAISLRMAPMVLNEVPRLLNAAWYENLDIQSAVRDPTVTKAINGSRFFLGRMTTAMNYPVGGTTPEKTQEVQFRLRAIGDLLEDMETKRKWHSGESPLVKPETYLEDAPEVDVPTLKELKKEEEPPF